MRIIDRNRNTISNYTEDMGYLIPIDIIKEDVEPIDNITKFAYTGDDYEEARMCIPYEEVNTEPTPQDDIEALLIDQEYRITLLELGMGD